MKLHSIIAVSTVAAATLADKAAVAYVFAPGTSVLCQECAFITLDGKCTDYGGAERDVSPSTGSCNDWQDLRRGRIVGNGFRTKQQTAYTENAVGFGCRRCGHMDYASQDCNAVDKNSPGPTPGRIDPYGCCNLWGKDAKRGSLTEKEFSSL